MGFELLRKNVFRENKCFNYFLGLKIIQYLGKFVGIMEKRTPTCNSIHMKRVFRELIYRGVITNSQFDTFPTLASIQVLMFDMPLDPQCPF